MDYPIDTILDLFPALKREVNGQKVIFFDGPSGTQIAKHSLDAIISYTHQGNSNLGAQYATAIETEELVQNARQAMADLLGTKASEIAFGMNMTSLAFDISRALSRDWTKTDNIVVTELDHRANVDTWITAAEDKGTTVNWIRMDPETCTLDLDSLDEIITDGTKLVAIGHASNGIGTVNEVDKIAARAHDVGAVVVVDAVHSAPHILIDRDRLDADILLCSAYKFFGPHIGVAAIREELFDDLQVYRISTAPKNAPGKLETGTQSFEGLAGVIGAVDFIASLGQGDTRRDQIEKAYEKITVYEGSLAKRIRLELKARDEITIYQSDGEKTPTIAFRVSGKTPLEVCSALANRGIFAGDGHFYAKTIGDVLGLNETGGWIRIGMAPYNTDSEIDRFIAAIDDIIDK